MDGIPRTSAPKNIVGIVASEAIYHPDSDAQNQYMKNSLLWERYNTFFLQSTSDS